MLLLLVYCVIILMCNGLERCFVFCVMFLVLLWFVVVFFFLELLDLVLVYRNRVDLLLFVCEGI